MNRSKVLKVTVYFLILVLPMVLFIGEHEATHIYFAEEHNCENINLNGPSIGEGFWSSYSASVSYSGCNNFRELEIKQDMVEAVGYQKFTQMFLLSFILLVVLTMERKLRRIEEKLD